MTDRLICGIDIGSFKVAVVVSLVSPNDKELRIIGFNATEARGVKRGLIIDIDKITASVEESVEKAERMAGHKINRAFISVGGPHISSLNSHGIVAVSQPQGEIQESDVARVIEAARAISLSSTREIIEVAPRDYIVDGQAGIRNPVGMSGVRLEVDTHIITASRTNLKNIERCLTDLGIQNEGFVFSALASSDAVATETEKELGVAVVDMGGGKTDIALYVEGALSYSSSIPIGARHVTNDIAVGLRVSLESAERTKIYLSRALQSQEARLKKKDDMIDISELHLPENITEISGKSLIDGIVAPRLEELFKQIGAEIEKSGFADAIPSGLVITGGGALTLGVLETGKRIIGLPIRVGKPEKVIGLVDEVLDPQYASTVGLILYGRKNIMESESTPKNFNQIFKGMDFGGSMDKIKSFLKQFVP